jgi:hypothetical protein
MQPVGCDLVSAIADYQPTGPDHLQPGLQRANRLIAAGVIEPVIAHDKVSVKVSLPQRSVHSGGWLFHHRLNAGAMEVPQCQSQHPLDVVTAASSAMSLWFTGQRQAEPSGALRGEPPIGTSLTLKIGLETLIRLGLGHPLKR